VKFEHRSEWHVMRIHSTDGASHAGAFLVRLVTHLIWNSCWIWVQVDLN